ncbi:MAG: biopolymer transporter ExbD [Elusimicrobia bacterium]|nr:biopolymer transporter ExbD [Elusimicrobiota bacterium]
MAGGAELDDDDIVAGINVTPLVDVCLVLVIIFMVTAPLMSDPVIKVTLPKAHAEKGEEADKLTLTLGKDGQVALDYTIYKDMVMLEDDLKVKLAQSQSKVVILRADEDALHGRLTDLMAKAKDAGAQSLTIATEQKK